MAMYAEDWAHEKKHAVWHGWNWTVIETDLQAMGNACECIYFTTLLLSHTSSLSRFGCYSFSFLLSLYLWSFWSLSPLSSNQQVVAWEQFLYQTTNGCVPHERELLLPANAPWMQTEICHGSEDFSRLHPAERSRVSLRRSRASQKHQICCFEGQRPFVSVSAQPLATYFHYWMKLAVPSMVVVVQACLSERRVAH